MWWWLLVRNSHPCVGWTKLLLALLLPSFIYMHNLYAIGIIFFLSFLVSFIFSVPSVHMRADFMYHVIRGVFLEWSGAVVHYGKIYQLLLGNIRKKLMVVIIMGVIFLLSVYFLWQGWLVLGSTLFFGVLMFKMSALSDYASISYTNPTNKEWEILCQKAEN